MIVSLLSSTKRTAFGLGSGLGIYAATRIRCLPYAESDSTNLGLSGTDGAQTGAKAFVIW